MDPPILSGANLQVKSGFQGLLWLCCSPNPVKSESHLPGQPSAASRYAPASCRFSAKVTPARGAFLRHLLCGSQGRCADNPA